MLWKCSHTARIYFKGSLLRKNQLFWFFWSFLDEIIKTTLNRSFLKSDAKVKKHCLRIQFHTKLHNFTRKWSLKMVRTLLSLTLSFSYFVFDVEFLERNTLKSVILFCFLQIRNRNGHTNNVKKVWFHIPFIWGTRLVLGSPQCSRTLHDVRKNGKCKHCSVKGKFTTLGLTKSEYVDLLDPYFWMIK